MDEIIKAIIFAVMGAILAGLAQWAASRLLENSRDVDNKTNYRLVVRAELESVIKQMEKLKNSFNDRGYYPFASLNSLTARIVRLEQNISEVHRAGKSTEIQSKFVTTVTDISDLNQDMLNIENHLISEAQKSQERTDLISSGTATAKDKKQAIKDNMDAMTVVRTFVDQQRTARLVELVDVMRRTDALIEIFRDTGK